MQTGLHAYFQHCQYADLAQAKPSPTMLNNILNNLTIEARQTVMVGDQIPDILAAKHANIASITLYREKNLPGTTHTCTILAFSHTDSSTHGCGNNT